MINKFKRLLSEKKYGKLVLILTAILAVFTLIILAIYFIGKLLIANFDTIAFGLAVVSVAVYYINKHFESRNEDKERKCEYRKEVKAANERHQREIELLAAENSNNLIRKYLYAVLNETAATLNLVAPKSYTALDSQIPPSDNGRFVILHYVCQKNGDIDTAYISEVLNMNIRQKLSAGDFSELSTSAYIYEGRSYPIIIVDNIVDVGAYINIAVVICNEAYCEHICNKSIADRMFIDTGDKDF